MKNAIILLAAVLVSFAAIACPKEDRGGDVPETDSVRSGPETAAPVAPLAALGGGGYELELVLTAREPFAHRVRIRERAADVIAAETEAVLSVRPLNFYCDEEHFVLPVDAAAGEMAGPDIPAQRAFLVFSLADKSFRRFPVREHDAGSFGIAGVTLYVGSHLAESPNGSVAVIDLGSGKTAVVDWMKDGDGLKAIETWCPVIGLDAKGRVKIRLNDSDGRLYAIEGDHLVPAGEGELTPFINPELPIR